MYRGGAQGWGCIAAVWHMHTHASDNLWSDEDILPTVDPALLAAFEDGFPQYIRNCTAATHAMCYTLTPRISPFDPYHIYI